MTEIFLFLWILALSGFLIYFTIKGDDLIYALYENDRSNDFIKYGGLQFVVAIFIFTFDMAFYEPPMIDRLWNVGIMSLNIVVGVYLFQAQHFGEDKILNWKLLSEGDEDDS